MLNDAFEDLRKSVPNKTYQRIHMIARKRRLCHFIAQFWAPTSKVRKWGPRKYRHHIHKKTPRLSSIRLQSWAEKSDLFTNVTVTIRFSIRVPAISSKKSYFEAWVLAAIDTYCTSRILLHALLAKNGTMAASKSANSWPLLLDVLYSTFSSSYFPIVARGF